MPIRRNRIRCESSPVSFLLAAKRIYTIPEKILSESPSDGHRTGHRGYIRPEGLTPPQYPAIQKRFLRNPIRYVGILNRLTVSRAIQNRFLRNPHYHHLLSTIIIHHNPP